MTFSLEKEYLEILNLINKSKNIAIISHRNPDGDTTGSGIALFFALKKFSKNVDIYCQDTPKGKLKNIYGVENYKNELDKNKKYDLAIAVDSASIDRLGDFQTLIKKSKYSIQFDHHISNDKYAKNVNIVKNSSANCENVAFFLFYLLDVKKIDLFDINVVNALYTGLITDTGSFAFSSVTQDTLYTAYRLKQLGADSHKIVNDQISKIEYNVFRLKQLVINKANFYENKKIAISIITKEDFIKTNTDISNTDGLILNLLNIADVECAVMLSEASSNSYKVSIRTKTLDAVVIAQRISNGGGHIRASGCRIDGIIEEVIDKILKIIKDELNK